MKKVIIILIIILFYVLFILINNSQLFYENFIIREFPLESFSLLTKNNFKKKNIGSNCLHDYQCSSGHCIKNILKCGNINKKLPEGSSCVFGQNQCQPGLWCGGIPIKCRIKGNEGDYCPLDNKTCRDGLYCGSDSQCHIFKNPGENCDLNKECSSGICVKGAYKCGDSDGKLPEGTVCIIDKNDCQKDLWCGGKPIKCRGKGNIGDLCSPDNNNTCQKGLYCNKNSICQPKGHGGDSCLFNSECISENCSYDDILKYQICKWDISQKQTYNTLNPPKIGDCIGKSKLFSESYEAKKQGKNICEKIDGWQFSGEISDYYHQNNGNLSGHCRKNTKVPVCVKIS